MQKWIKWTVRLSKYSSHIMPHWIWRCDGVQSWDGAVRCTALLARRLKVSVTWQVLATCFFLSVALRPNAGHGLPHSWGFLDHTRRRTTIGRTPLDEWSARRRDLYLTTHNTHNRQTPMPPVGFEPTISAGERPQTYALDRATTGTGYTWIHYTSLNPLHLRNINWSNLHRPHMNLGHAGQSAAT